VVARAIRAAALALSALMILSFALFAVDQASTASRASQNGVAGITSADQSGQYAPAPRRESGIRHDIDSANDAVLSPFQALGAHSSNAWADRGLRTLLGLLVYGLGLGFLARWTAAAPGRPRPSGRTRAAS